MRLLATESLLRPIKCQENCLAVEGTLFWLRSRRVLQLLTKGFCDLPDRAFGTTDNRPLFVSTFHAFAQATIAGFRNH